MKNFKRFLAVVLAVMFVVTSAAISISAGSNSKAWYKEAVEYLDELTISNIGTTADQELSREEFVTWVAKLESHQLNENGWLIWEYTANATFSDVEESDHLGAIGWSVNREFIVGNNDGTDTTLPTFAPDRTVSLAEAAAVVVRMMGYAKSVPGDTSNWAVNNIHVANTLCKAFDETFLTEVGTFDPDYKLTKGEGAYILYTIMNGKYHSEGKSTTDATTGKLKSDVITTYNGVDLGEWFASASNTTVKLQVMVTDLGMKTSDGAAATDLKKDYIYQRADAIAIGVAGNYDVLKTYNGWIDTSKDVTLAQVGTKAVPTSLTTLGGAVFNALIRKTLGLGSNDKTTNILESVEIGSVITLKMTKKNYEELSANEALFSTDDVKNGKVTATISNTYVSDTYIGSTAQSSADVRKEGKSLIGWTAASVASSANVAYARISTNYLNWTNIVYNKDGSVKSADLVVGDQTYKVVTEYTGADNEILVYAPGSLFDDDGKLNLNKKVISVVANAGDVIYAGAVLRTEDIKKVSSDYDIGDDGFFIKIDGERVAVSNNDGNYFTVLKDITLTETINSGISYELEVEGGALVTHQGLALVSNLFDKDGNLNNAIDITNPLTVAEAYELILAPAQGECNVVLSDVDGDGIYDIAVVTESTRALYYGSVNASNNPGSYGYVSDMISNSVYDSFGNYITSTIMLKGMGVGGLVVDKTVSTTVPSSSNSGTDCWTFSDVSTDTVQLVVVGSNERGAAYTKNFAGTYGNSSMWAYDIVDVADLTTAYIKEVATNPVIVDGVKCYKATVIDSANKASTVYVPVVIKDQVTLDVTVDGITSKVTFNCGKSLLSFVDGHVTEGVGGTAVVDSSAWMAGHTVKYVVDEDTNIAWCMVDTVEEDAASGYVVSVEKALKDNEGNNTYKITLATTVAASSSSVAYKHGEITPEIAKANTIPNKSYRGIANLGVDAIVDPMAKVNIYVAKNNISDPFISGNRGSATKVVVYSGVWEYTSSANYNPNGEIVAETSTSVKAGDFIVENDYLTYVNDQNKSDFEKVNTEAWKTWTALYLGGNVIFAEGAYREATSSDTGAIKLTIQVLTKYYELLNAGKNTNGNENYKEENISNIAEADYFNPVFYTFTEKYYSSVNSYYYTPWKYVVSSYKSNSVATYTVKGSATSIWNYDATTYSMIHDLLVNGNKDNFSKTNDIGAVKADDLLYITLAKDAGDYYTIQGVDSTATASLEDKVVISTSYNTTYDDVDYDYSFAFKHNTYKVGAANEVNWIYADTAEYANEHILGYTVQKNGDNEITNELADDNGNKYGYYKVVDMVIGSNPYYERVLKSDGKTYTFVLKFTSVKKVTGIHAEYKYALDLSKTIVRELYYANTLNQLVDTNGDYAKDANYYVDPKTNYVYRIESDTPVYDTKNSTFVGYNSNVDGVENKVLSSYEYDETGNTVINGAVWGEEALEDGVLFTNVKAACGLKSDVTTYASLTLKAFTEDDEGYFPGKYFAVVDSADGNTEKWIMSESTKIVVITPNAETGKLDIKYTTAKALYDSESTLFITGYQTADDVTKAVTMISVIGAINGKPADVVVDPSDTIKDTVSEGTKLVYLGAGSNIVADMGETDNLWIVKSESSAYDVTTGKEIGSIQITYNMYLDKNQTKEDATAYFKNGGYYIVDANNEVIAIVDDTTAGTYGSEKTGLATVKTGTITNVDATGKTIANIDGKKDVDVSNYTFKFIYHDIGERVEGGYAYGDNFGIGGSNTGVTLNTEKQIADTWSSYEKMIDDYNGENKNEYTKEEYEAALEAIEAAKEAAVGSYLNGTFWNVAYSPAYRYVQNQLISFQAKSAEINFNYVVIDDVYYVFVNTFAK